MAESLYWPNLCLLPPGWHLFRIEWSCGRVVCDLHRNGDNALARSSGHHRSPRGAFEHACLRAVALAQIDAALASAEAT